MPVALPEIKSFLGLYLQANSFQVPDGALEQAENVVISKDNKISKTRGYYQYFDPSSDTLNNLFLYQNKIIAVMSDKVRYLVDAGSAPNFTGTATTLSGSTVAVSGVSLSVQSNNNLYFTTDNGVLKLESYNSKIYTSGTPPALDLRGVFRNIAGPIKGDSQVAYRIVFGRRDANDNLLLGVPSDILILANLPATGATWSRTTNVVTVTYAGHNLTTGMLITVSDSTGTVPVPAGEYVVTVSSSSVFTFTSTAANSSGTLSFKADREIRLEFSVPTEITTVADSYFYQIYRSTQTSSATASPSSDFKLVDEVKLTSSQISSHIVFYDDQVDDVLLGAELYTNPNSREGELQSNYRAPLCKDLTLYKNHVIYANCTTRHLLNQQLVDPSVMASGDFIEVKVDALTLRYVARTGVGNTNVTAESVSGTSTITITYTAHGLVNGDGVLISRVTGTLPEGGYTISGVTPNTFDVTSATHSATDLDFQGVTDGTYGIFTLDNVSSSFSVQLRNTAEGFIKAINRDSQSVVYAKYVSGITDIPGQIQLQAKGFGGAIYLRANTDASGAAWSPPFPSSFASGDQVYSRNESQPNFWYAAKTGEPEAVPIVNNFPTGSQNKALLRCIALRDSIIMLKEDGVFRVTGDSVANFSTTVLDSTVVCVAPSSVQVLNNQVMFLSNQGVCLVTESAVQIISRKIEDVIQPIIGLTNIDSQTGGLGYESERAYFITTIPPNSTTAGTTYIYNIINDSWTQQTTIFKRALIGPADTAFLISTGNKILKERKNQTKIDYCGQNYSVTVLSVTSNLIVTVSSTVPPLAGDVIVKSDVLNRIDSVTLVGVDYQITFSRQHNLLAADTPILYQAYTSTIKTSPFHAGAVGRGKQFSQMQIHLRENSISKLLISFTGQTYGGSEEVTWSSTLTSEGWGLSPWGFFPWGQQELINLSFRTEPAPVIRIYIPRFQQRGTFIQPVLTHKQAGEPLSIQALAFAVRGYAERVTK